MKQNSGSEADGLNTVEAKDLGCTYLRGDSPITLKRPIRKKGRYRAIKSKKSWALREEQLKLFQGVTIWL